MIRNFNDETNFLRKLLITDMQVSKIRKNFENGLSANIQLWEIQLPKIEQLWGVLLDIPTSGNISSSVAK